MNCFTRIIKAIIKAIIKSIKECRRIKTLKYFGLPEHFEFASSDVHEDIKDLYKLLGYEKVSGFEAWLPNALKYKKIKKGKK